MDGPVVEINQGKLRGKTLFDMDGNKYYKFGGIPYAKPPIKDRRFKAPLPPEPWQGILDATNDGNCCYSKDLFTKQYLGSEDCLVLNIYTSELNTSILKPVMFWIHGGGFTCGSNSAEIYGPEFLITADIVLVSINYRLGIFGFLSLDDPSLGVPGNAAFKDMVMALRWTNLNIDKFSGDPHNITIFGESSGGVAVHLLMLSPMSQGLFHKAIAQSGCALNPGSKGRSFARDICSVLGCKDELERDMLSFLQDLPMEKLLEAQEQLPYFLDPSKVHLFGWVLENTDREEVFLSEDPIDIMMSKKFKNVPFMLGFTKDEGLMVESYKPQRSANMWCNFENNIPHYLGFTIGSDRSKDIAAKIQKFYFGNEKPCFKNRRQFYQMATDILFFHGIYHTARKHLNPNCPVYLYRMSVETCLRFLRTIMANDESGAAHCDDLAYLFKNKFIPNFPPNSLESISVRRFVKLWTNFARFGDPTPDPSEMNIVWEKFSIENMHFLDIGSDLMLHKNPSFEAIQLWDEIFLHSPRGRDLLQ